MDLESRSGHAGEAAGDLGAEAEDCAAGLDGPDVAAAPAGPVPGREDPGLTALSLPVAAIRRTAKSAAPGVRFSSEAIAALHRVAQAFICFATDRALQEGKIEADKAKKVKGKAANPAARKTLTADHVMRFLSSDMPPLSKKLATLFPELMPAEHKPAAVRLLEQLQEQERARAAPAEAPQEAAAAPSGASLLAAFAATEGRAPEGQDGAEAGDTVPGQPGADGAAEAEPGAPPGAARAGQAKRKRGAEGGEPAAKKQAKVPQAKVPASAPLTQFFGKSAAASTSGPVATPARAASQEC